ncbi:oligosaccharide flippase family protein [Flavobacterium sp.]|uniref:lipopolysaccharide biosynthesis protein n=1 Tax=Flavobacterium sp. TaxID=239 RepID=UPI00286DC84D|nr:oligosaccharide flippase family protein [Flavobacterium sp.]
MGVVARQSIKYGFVGYFSVLIGIFSTLFIYPNDLEFAGKLQFILPTALLIFPLVSIGIIPANIRFFPRLSKTNDHFNLLKFSALFLISNFIFVTILFFIASFLFPRIQKMDIWQMALYVFPVLFILSLIQLISKYISIKKRIVVPNILENVLPKLGMISAFLAYSHFNFSEKNAILVFVSFFVLALFGMVVYLLKLDAIPAKTSFQFLKENNFQKELLTFSFYTFFGSLGSVVALNIDTYMIGEFLGYSDIAIYNTSFNLVRMITVPALGVYTISAPIIADYIENNKLKELKDLHHKTSLYLFTLGAVLFSLIVVGIDDLFLLMKNGAILSQGKNVIYIMGFALLFDLATGFNGYIITNSKYYKFNNTTTFALAFLTISSNLFFIFYLKLGIIGVATATSISITLYNVIKIWFNYKKFGVHPFSNQYFYSIGFIILSILIGFILPNSDSKSLNLCYKPFVVLILFFVGNSIFKVIPIAELVPKKIKHFFSSGTQSH